MKLGGFKPEVQRMRLSEHDKKAIRSVCAEIAGPDARVHLFGSRVRDDLRGGDIDLWIDLPEINPDKFGLSVRLGTQLQWLIGERKIDILVTDPQSTETPLMLSAKREAVML